MNQIERRDTEMPYVADEEVCKQQMQSRRLTQELNSVDRSDFDAIGRIVKELLGKSEGAFINPPFYCDYGFNIEVGKNFYANFNCTILDVGKVKIGDNCLFAPNVSIYTAGHPVHPDSRNSGYEYGISVTIGDNCWIGGSVVICPGVHIGNNVVIGAGSVVTKDIPDWSVAAGNPCKVIRKITEKDRKYYYKNQKFDEKAWADMETRGFGEKYRFRMVRPNEAETAEAIETICFPPNEACILPIMKQRVQMAPECFVVMEEKSTGKAIGYINAITTDESKLRDEFFTDIRLHDPKGQYVMILSVAVLPEYRGQGLATEMMAEFLKRQRKNGKKGAVLTCLESKVNLYRRMGFVDQGISDSSWGGESWHEMTCEL